MLMGGVLWAQPCRRLSYFLKSGPEDPSTCLTWRLDSRPGGSIVHLEVDRAECADTEGEAGSTWLPVLASLQSLLPRDGTSRPQASCMSARFGSRAVSRIAGHAPPTAADGALRVLTFARWAPGRPSG